MTPAPHAILASIEGLDPFPHVAVRVLELADRGQPDAAELLRVVRTDPGLTAKVLRHVNAADRDRPATSVRQAAERLGADALADVVLGSCAEGYYAGLGAASVASSRAVWEESVAVALACRLVATTTGGVDPELAFTVGLLQNVGHVVIDRFFFDEQAAIARLADAGSPRLDAERTILGLDHAALGARVLASWGLPDVLIDAVRHHHAPERAVQEPDLCRMAELAEAIAWEVLEDRDFRRIAYGVSGRTQRMLRVDWGQLPALTTLLRSELATSRAVTGYE